MESVLFFIEISGIASITFPLCEEMKSKGFFSAEEYYETRAGGELRIMYRSDYRRAQALEWIKEKGLEGGFLVTETYTEKPLSDFIEDA